MKTLLSLVALLLLSSTQFAFAQQPTLDYFRDPGKAGLNVFETPKTEAMEFDGIKVRIGGDFAFQFQGLTQENDLNNLVELSNNFTLPAANLNIDVQLQKGFRLHLRTFLSSRHHNESWVKGGHVQIDNLDFISEDFLSGMMELVTFRVGMDEINYGDTRFRRTDNSRAMYNPFVGNYILDSYTTEPFGEVTIQSNGFLGVLGFSNGRLNQEPAPGDDGFVIFGKVGYDKQMNEELRVRLTGSFYNSSSASTRDYLFNGDRAGARYYKVMESPDDSRVSDFLPRFNPGFGYLSAFQINPFVKFNGLEFFGVFEVANDGNSDSGFTQIGAELIYRLGANENFYVGGRFNSVSGDNPAGATQELSRINIGGGWFLTNNVLAKIEYMNQSYDGAGFAGSKFEGAKINGLVLETVIGF